MADIQITRSEELIVLEVTGISERGVEFVDRYVTSGPMYVLDAGRIMLPIGEYEQLTSAAYEQLISYSEQVVH